MPRKQKILVADDSLTVRKLVEMVLVQEGYEVVLAETGGNCLALCASSPPDLILLDYLLPDMKGLQVCQTLMNSPKTWEIPVLLMSGNGNAIRQLYQDMNNVADYLTKPFPPNVLKAVVAHVMQKQRAATRPASPKPPAELAEALVTVAALPAPAAAPAPTPVPTPSPTPEAPVAKVDATHVIAPREPDPIAIVSHREVPEVVVQKIRQILQTHWQTAWKQIPAWERERAGDPAETYYRDRFFAEAAWREMGADLLSAAGLTTGNVGAFRAPSGLVRLDGVLRHLHTARATGELRVELGEETVNIFLSDGHVVFVSSNNPRQYCAGATFGFHCVPHAVIAEAVQAQETGSIPFFVSLEDAGCLGRGRGPALDILLRDQGERAVVRAYRCETATCDFRPLERLPELVMRYRGRFALWQLLLLCYRTVEDWFTIEQSLPGYSAGLTSSHECAVRLRDLRLEECEEQLLAAMPDARTVQQVVEISGLDPYVASKVLFRFLKLGLFFSVASPEEADPGTSFVVRAARGGADPDGNALAALPATPVKPDVQPEAEAATATKKGTVPPAPIRATLSPPLNGGDGQLDPDQAKPSLTGIGRASTGKAVQAVEAREQTGDERSGTAPSKPATPSVKPQGDATEDVRAKAADPEPPSAAEKPSEPLPKGLVSLACVYDTALQRLAKSEGTTAEDKTKREAA